MALVYFSPNLLFQFMPARVDHHALQILIAGFGLWGFSLYWIQHCPKNTLPLRVIFLLRWGWRTRRGYGLVPKQSTFVALFSILLGAAVIAMPNQLAKPVQKYALTLIFATAIFSATGEAFV